MPLVFLPDPWGEPVSGQSGAGHRASGVQTFAFIC